MRLEDEEIDCRLRSAVEPNAQIIDRVVREALAAQPQRVNPMQITVRTLLAVAVCLAIVLVGRKSPDPPVEVFRLEYVGNLAVFEYPDGSTLLLTPDSIDRGPRSQLNLIIIGGDKP
jgi:hypothetical protein